MPDPVSEKKVENPSSFAEGEPSMRRPSGWWKVSADSNHKSSPPSCSPIMPWYAWIIHRREAEGKDSRSDRARRCTAPNRHYRSEHLHRISPYSKSSSFSLLLLLLLLLILLTANKRRPFQHGLSQSPVPAHINPRPIIPVAIS